MRVNTQVASNFFESSVFDIPCFEEAKIGVIEIDEQRRIQKWNSNASQFLGFSVSEIPTDPIHYYFVPEDQTILEELLKVPLVVHENQIISRIGECRLNTLQHHFRYLQIRSIYKELKRNDSSPYLGFRLYVTDTSRFHRHYQEIKRSWTFMQNLLDALDDPVFVKDENHIWVVVNRKTCETWGYSKNELLGKSDYDFFPKDQADIFWEKDNLVLKTGKPNINIQKVQLKNGQIRSVLTQKSLFLDPHTGKKYITGIIHDITTLHQIEQEKMQLQYQLLQSQKMEAIGELASGISHDFRNILTSIIGYSKLIQMDISKLDPDNTAISRKIDQILQAGSRANHLIQQLLGYAKEENIGQVKSFDLNSIVVEAVELMEKGISTLNPLKISCFLNSSHHISGYESQIHQIISNLILNSNDAMKFGGNLFIETHNCILEDSFEGVFHPIPAGNYVKLSILDEGEGISQECLPNIFDPFYTTKNKSKGTGLGLASVWRILQKHRGYINVYENSPKGSVFELYFPATLLNPPQCISPKETCEPKELCNCHHHHQRILVVDDDTSILHLTKSFLIEKGYQAETAVNGLDGLNQFIMNPHDLIITDLVMKTLNGEEMIRLIDQYRTNIPVIIISGYEDTRDKNCFIKRNNLYHLEKPFELDTLFELIHQIISKNEP